MTDKPKQLELDLFGPRVEAMYDMELSDGSTGRVFTYYHGDKFGCRLVRIPREKPTKSKK